MNGTQRIDMVNDRAVTARTTPPAWLVAVCRFILWLTKESVRETVIASCAVICVGFIAILAGGMSFGVVPLGTGVIICAALSGIAFLLTGAY